MPDNLLEALLECWGRFIAGSWTPGRCGSAEGRYLRERIAADDDHRPTPREFSELELWAVEAAVAALPQAYGRLVRGVWCRRWDVCRAMRIARLTPSHRTAWPVHRNEAFALLRQRLAV